MLKRSLDTANETSHVFVLPAVLQVPGNTLIERAEAWQVRVTDAAGELDGLQQHIDEVTYRLYGIVGESIQPVQGSSGEEVTPEDVEAEEDETSIEGEESLPLHEAPPGYPLRLDQDGIFGGRL